MVDDENKCTIMFVREEGMSYRVEDRLLPYGQAVEIEKEIAIRLLETGWFRLLNEGNMSKRVQKDGKLDTSLERIAYDPTPLPFSEEQLYAMTCESSAETIKEIPGFKYWACRGDQQMCLPVNCCGHQQRAWEYYWCIKEGLLHSRIILGIGTGGVSSPCEFGMDLYGGEDHPVYGGDYLNSHMKRDGSDIPYPFPDEVFGGVFLNHTFEHLKKQDACIREWWRLLLINGIIGIIQPDMSFCDRMTLDKSHTTEWCADEFKLFVEGLNLPGFEWVCHNTLNNCFSFDSVFRKRGLPKETVQ